MHFQLIRPDAVPVPVVLPDLGDPENGGVRLMAVGKGGGVPGRQASR